MRGAAVSFLFGLTATVSEGRATGAGAFGGDAGNCAEVVATGGGVTTVVGAASGGVEFDFEGLTGSAGLVTAAATGVCGRASGSAIALGGGVKTVACAEAADGLTIGT